MEIKKRGEYSYIPLEIDYSTVYADIYIVPKKYCFNNLKLTDPPIGKDVTSNVLDESSDYKISKGNSPLKIALNEKAFIVIYQKNGAITFDHITPIHHTNY